MSPLPLVLANQIRSCTACPLHRTCTAPVPFRGPTPADIAIIGEAPGQDEDIHGQPFIGKAGQFLNGALLFAGFDLDTLFVANAVCCRPPGNRKPRFEEMRACSLNLRDQLNLANPRFVILLGSTALYAFRPDLRITRVHGQPFTTWDERIYLPTFHPAAALRNPDWRDEMLLDLVAFRGTTLAADPYEAAFSRASAAS